MFKTLLASALVLSATTAMADQMPETQELCGTLKVERRMCVVAPCFNGIFLQGRSGSHTIELVDGGGLQTALEAKNRKKVCVEAFENVDGSFTVVDILR